MDRLILLAMLLIPAYLLQTVLGLKQMKRFGQEYKRMRKDGKVAIGRQAGKVFSGVLVMLSLDNEGNIVYGRKLQGTSVIAKFKDFNLLNGHSIEGIEKESILLEKEFKNTKRAVIDAVNNYNLIMNGKQIPEKKAPLTQVYEKLNWKKTA